ncbi:MAG: hypothetical protein MUC47_06570 [Candidatus Kapabacteria bacterium]|nr:hypothetical protein [Candidatus Kapabacteria bacterium]
MPTASAVLYWLTALLGIVSRWTTLRFGVLHHIMFAITIVHTGLTLVIEPTCDVGSAMVALCCMPFLSPRHVWHGCVGLIGGLGYMIVFIGWMIG